MPPLISREKRSPKVRRAFKELERAFRIARRADLHEDDIVDLWRDIERAKIESVLFHDFLDAPPDTLMRRIINRICLAFSIP